MQKLKTSSVELIDNKLIQIKLINHKGLFETPMLSGTSQI